MLTRGRRPNAQGVHVWGYSGVHKGDMQGCS